MKIRLRKARPCPYCLTYSMTLYECEGCGAVLCKRCIILFRKDTSLCSDCTSKAILPNPSMVISDV